MALDFTQLLASIASQGQRVEESGNKALDAGVQKVVITGEMASSLAPLGDENNITPRMHEEVLQIKHDQDAAIRSYANAAGFVGVNAIIDDTAAVMKKAYMDAMAAAERVSAIESQSFTSNPMGWLMNKISPDPAYAEYEAAASRFNIASQGHTALSNAITSTAQAVKVAPMPVSMEARQSSVEAAKRVLEQKRQALLLAAHNTNEEALEKVAKFDQQQLDNYIRTAHLYLSGEALRDKQNTAEIKDNVADVIAAGYETIHGTPAPEAMRKSIDFALKTGQLKDDMSIYYDHGTRIMAMSPNDSRYGAFGGTAGESYETIKITKPQLSGTLGASYNEIFGPLNLEGDPQYLKLKTADEKALYINAAITQERTRQLANISDLDGTNPYRIAPLGTFNSQDPRYFKLIRDTQLWKKVYEPLVAAGHFTTLSHDKLFGVAAQAVINKTLSAEQAAKDLTTIVAAAQTMNYIAKMHNKLGLPEPDAYTTSINLVKATDAALVAYGQKPLSGMYGVIPDTAVTELVTLNNVNSVLSALRRYGVLGINTSAIKDELRNLTGIKQKGSK